RDLEFDDRVAEVVLQRGTLRRIVLENQDALVLIRDTQFLFGANHALGLDAANLARLEGLVLQLLGVAVDQAGAGKGEGDLLPLRDIRRAGNDGQATIFAGINVGEDKAVGIRMGLYIHDLTDVDLVPTRANLLDARGFETGHRQAGGKVGGRNVDVDQVLKPTIGYVHVLLIPFDESSTRYRSSLSAVSSAGHEVRRYGASDLCSWCSTRR